MWVENQGFSLHWRNRRKDEIVFRIAVAGMEGPSLSGNFGSQLNTGKEQPFSNVMNGHAAHTDSDDQKDPYR